MGTRHLYWILSGPSFAVRTTFMTHTAQSFTRVSSARRKMFVISELLRKLCYDNLFTKYHSSYISLRTFIYYIMTTTISIYNSASAIFQLALSNDDNFLSTFDSSESASRRLKIIPTLLVPTTYGPV